MGAHEEGNGKTLRGLYLGSGGQEYLINNTHTHYSDEAMSLLS
jgi:hypothetical protein